MAMEITEKTYLLGIWFVQFKNGNDWMLFFEKADKPNFWNGKYRFRERKDDNIFNSNDIKEWHTLTGKIEETEEQAIKTAREIQTACAEIYGKRIEFFDELLVQGGMKELLEKSEKANKIWMNLKKFNVKHANSN